MWGSRSTPVKGAAPRDPASSPRLWDPCCCEHQRHNHTHTQLSTTHSTHTCRNKSGEESPKRWHNPRISLLPHASATRHPRDAPHQCRTPPDHLGSRPRASSSCRRIYSRVNTLSRNMTGQTAPIRQAGAISHVAAPRPAQYIQLGVCWTQASSLAWAL
jgi:hypothetical protein